MAGPYCSSSLTVVDRRTPGAADSAEMLISPVLNRRSQKGRVTVAIFSFPGSQAARCTVLRPPAALASGGMGGFCGTLLLLLLGWEGMICIVMALPIAVPLAAVGGLLAYEMDPERHPKDGFRRAGLLLLLPPISLAWDLNAPTPVFEVRTSIEINAPPETVWRNVVSFSDLPEPEEWYFRTGIAYPKNARRRIEVDEWLFWQVGGFGPMLGQANHFRLYAKEKISYGIERYTTESSRLYGVLDRRLADREYVCGDYSIADIASFPWARTWKNQGQDISSLPNVAAWLERMEARPAVKRGLAAKAK